MRGYVSNLVIIAEILMDDRVLRQRCAELFPDVFPPRYLPPLAARYRLVPARPARTPCLSTFPMCVPSLSWQSDRFHVQMAPKRAISAPLHKVQVAIRSVLEAVFTQPRSDRRYTRGARIDTAALIPTEVHDALWEHICDITEQIIE